MWIVKFRQSKEMEYDALKQCKEQNSEQVAVSRTRAGHTALSDSLEHAGSHIWRRRFLRHSKCKTHLETNWTQPGNILETSGNAEVSTVRDCTTHRPPHPGGTRPAFMASLPSQPPSLRISQRGRSLEELFTINYYINILLWRN